MFGKYIKLTKDQWDQLNKKFDDMKSKLRSQSDTIEMLTNQNELLQNEVDDLKKDGFLLDALFKERKSNATLTKENVELKKQIKQMEAFNKDLIKAYKTINRLNETLEVQVETFKVQSQINRMLDIRV